MNITWLFRFLSRLTMSHSSLDKSLHICREPPFRNTCKAVKIFRSYSERYWGLRFRDTEKSNSRNSAVSYVQSFLVFSLTILLLRSPNGTDVRHTHQISHWAPGVFTWSSMLFPHSWRVKCFLARTWSSRTNGVDSEWGRPVLELLLVPYLLLGICGFGGLLNPTSPCVKWGQY